MLSKKDKYIAEMIISAQIASDSGKNISWLYDDLEKDGRKKPNYDTAYDNGYAVKDVFIDRAIKAINTSRNSIFRYAVVNTTIGWDDDDCSIIYFSYKLGDQKYQVSFHSFSYEHYRMAKKVWSVSWDKGDSRKNCWNLAYEL